MENTHEVAVTQPLKVDGVRLLSEKWIGRLLIFLDIICIGVVYQICVYSRIHIWNLDTLLSHKHLLVLFSIAICGYIMDANVVEFGKSFAILIYRLIISIVCAWFVIIGVFYLCGLAWTGGGYELLGRGIILPSILAFTVISILYRLVIYYVFINKATILNWLYIQSGDDIMSSEIMGNFSKKYSNRKVYSWDSITENLSTEKDGLVNCIDTLNFDQILERSWVGLVLSENINLSDSQIEKIMQRKLLGLKVYTTITFYEEIFYRIPVKILSHKWFAYTDGFGLLLESGDRKIKRLADILISLIFIFILSPLYVIIPIFVLLSGPGPIIYKQIRCGLRNAKFTIYKFRTMKNDSEKAGVAQWAISGDKRVTWIGIFLRKCRLDEIPQLYNILKGEMSFIGPRPERPEFEKQLETEIPFFSLRLLVKPGLTGWAQINHLYTSSIVDTKDKLEYDLYYIKNQSMLLDFIIVLRTIKVVLLGTGAK